MHAQCEQFKILFLFLIVGVSLGVRVIIEIVLLFAACGGRKIVFLQNNVREL